MRFKVQLSIDKNAYGNALPFSYQYELSSFIYHTLAKGNAEYAEWLHENGFSLEGKQFRLFVFSPLLLKASVNKDINRLILVDDVATMQIGFLPERSTEEFVKGVFAEQRFTLGDKISKVQFSITGIELMPTPEWGGEMRGETLSPICLSQKNEEGQVHYFSASAPEAGEAVINNLRNKYRAFYGKPFAGDTAFEWETTSEPRAKLITVKAGTPQQTKIRASLCRFRLKADNELLRIGYEAGLGEKNSMGFGMVK
ncbi:CRISPR-associated endoribonuclease Cas6 [Microbacter margulisiae]|uniref:CRISPR-associated endoribonuclease n=1 Tax=Microbacter margulisiae TaxID=1350067 RepID=A0A7W5H154_9PORP|nr:CRISPR-associated endoribonuclease Cas6 [Microbacter margulisiae]MBB3186017.1 CRISPR-associated endoribonuclease Cas6 [Microbacter margulisiae]